MALNQAFALVGDKSVKFFTENVRTKSFSQHKTTFFFLLIKIDNPIN
jgi:hypothetical protein